MPYYIIIISGSEKPWTTMVCIIAKKNSAAARVQVACLGNGHRRMFCGQTRLK